ncbi:PAS domain S-box protein [Roseomonas stagni]|uniref:PAS domain S-box protein n=1 Tax=Falsiroseomonas algicola TaxID=2716930 RepID=A0A6M1LNY9_9PROT|nr:methyl-accepting chemotaxis protein [Falsiroseomonas algicola]NGM21719.1 PAS domain S-box protein [Falsiroseomonas algicola]
MFMERAARALLPAGFTDRRSGQDRRATMRSLVAAQAALQRAQAMLTLSVDGRILEANERFAALLGMAPEAVAGRPLAALLTRLERDGAACRSLLEKLSRGEDTVARLWHQGSGGIDVLLDYACALLPTEEGAVAAAAVVVRDVTVAAAGEARALADRATIEASATPMMMLDADGVLRHANGAARAMLRQHAAGFRAHWPDLDPAAPDGARLTDLPRDLFARRGGAQRAEIDIGAARFALVATALEGSGERLLEWQDITEQSGQRARFTALDRAMGRIEFGLDGRVLDANAGFLATFGYTLEEVRGQHHSLFVDPAERLTPEYRAFWEKLGRGDYDAGRYKRIAKGGREVWIQASYNPVLDAEGRPVRVVKYAADVTAATEREADLRGQIAAIDKAQAVIEFSLDGRVLTANTNFLTVLGYTLDQVRGQHHSMFVDPAERMSPEYRAFWDKLGRGEYDAGRYRRLGQGGREIWIQASYNPILDLNGRPFKVVKYATDVTGEVMAARALAAMVAKAEQVVAATLRNEFGSRIPLDGVEGSIAALAEGINRIADGMEAQFHFAEALRLAVGETQAVVAAAQANDISQRVPLEGKTGEIAALCGGVNGLLDTMRSVLSAIAEGCGTITTASREIAMGNTDLSQRTEEQASSLEETSASLEELTSTVKQNADSAVQANKLAASASEIATRGGMVVTEVVRTMDGITQSSRKISDIIGVIDEIAFQTNILALNAAVEAARAGDQGRGFAVVAAEVRNLAQRSANAAKEIKALISDSVQKVDSGSKLVASAGQTMDEIVRSVKRVTDIMAEISAASQEQSAGIEQVNVAVAQMDKITQQNSALVEEAAAAAKSMEQQTDTLMQMVAAFSLDGKVAAPPAPKSAAPASAPRAVKRPARVTADAADWREF